MAKTIAELENELGGLTDNVESLVLTLSDLAISNITSENSTLPSIGLNEDGTLGLFEDSEQVPFSRFERGVTQEKLIVKKEIIVSSDQVDKQSVEEIDFDKNDFAATRAGKVLTVQLKDKSNFLVFVSSSDPSFTNTISDGNLWFVITTGKMYVRYNDVWVQPHPQ
tara:strand:+ start:265 stop:762 length:498 start_codon:yes stop_codon:yes gene_type:complete